MTHVHPSLTFSQRWVSEKLSVESLRDLELFGGEFNSPASDVDVLLVPLSANPPAWAYSTIARVSVKGSLRNSNLKISSYNTFIFQDTSAIFKWSIGPSRRYTFLDTNPPHSQLCRHTAKEKLCECRIPMIATKQYLCRSNNMAFGSLFVLRVLH